jgi:hypothetical protein
MQVLDSLWGGVRADFEEFSSEPHFCFLSRRCALVLLLLRIRHASCAPKDAARCSACAAFARTIQLMTTKTAGVIAPQHCHRHEQALAAAVRPSPSPAFSHPCPGSSFPARSALERSRRHSLGSGRCGRCRIGTISFAPFSVSRAHSRAGSCFRAKTRRAGFVSHARLRVQGPFAAFRGYHKLCTFNISCIQLPPALSTSAAFSFPHSSHPLPSHIAQNVP